MNCYFLLQDMSYREKPATPNSPSGTTVTTVYDHILSPPSPAEEEEKNDRIRNDLLDEICEDMGIDDSMDLDFDDFCYSGQQQQNAGSAQRFTQVNTPGKAADSDGRRTGASGYASSDSLCAIARLTRSITNENSSSVGSEVDSKRPSSSSPAECTDSVKQEPSDAEFTEQMAASFNDTDQSKAAAAANKLALLKQLNDSSSTEMKRKRSGERLSSQQPEVSAAEHRQQRQWGAPSSELPLNYSHNQPSATAAQR